MTPYPSEVGSPDLPDSENQVRRRHAQRLNELLKQIAAVTNVSTIRDLPARKRARQGERPIEVSVADALGRRGRYRIIVCEDDLGLRVE